MKIAKMHAREILDSRGVPTIDIKMTLEDGTTARAAVPSGASTGLSEAFELRDEDPKRYFGKGVLKAVDHINTRIAQAIDGKDFPRQADLDQALISLDGTENKRNLGANAILAVSMAFCRAMAASKQIPLYRYFQELTDSKEIKTPQMAILIMEGGKHGDWATDFQEFMIIPKRDVFPTVEEALRAGAEIFQATHDILDAKGYSATVGFEGAYAPKEIRSNTEAFDIIIEGIQKAGYQPGTQILLGLDAAASEFYAEEQYSLHRENQKLRSDEYINWIISWINKYPIWSLEDMLGENDWNGWTALTKQVGNDHQIIGDDLLTTNTTLIQKAIDLKACNSVLIKINQIGTITETLEAIKLADSANFTTMISHRSGETNDDFIADLVMGTSSWQTKFGGPDRGERLAKYNRLLTIEDELKETAQI